MHNYSEFDIVIIGGGMVGLAAACGLARTALRIAIVEPQPLSDAAFPDAFDLRVSALSHASQTLLNNLHAWHDVVAARLAAFSRMEVWDADGTGNVHFEAAEMGEKHLGWIVENRIVTRALEKQAKQQENLVWFNPDSLAELTIEEDQVSLTLTSGATLTTKLLIGADGANSRVRQLANFELNVRPYNHQGIVTTVRTELPHQNTARQRFMQTGPLALLPLRGNQNESAKGGHYCSIVWSAQDELTQEVMQMDDAAFCKALGEAFEFKLGKIEWADRRLAIPLVQRHAPHYAKPRVALIGDAAHTIHPLAGQGVNLGFLDAAVLIEEISRAVELKLDPGLLAVLRRFERRRKGHNLTLMAAMQGFKSLFEANPLPVRWLRNEGMRIFNSLPPVKNFIMLQAMGIEGDLPALARR